MTKPRNKRVKRMTMPVAEYDALIDKIREVLPVQDGGASGLSVYMVDDDYLRTQDMHEVRFIYQCTFMHEALFKVDNAASAILIQQEG